MQLLMAAYVRRTRWEAQAMAAATVNALGTALGGSGGMPARGGGERTGRGADRRVQPDAMLAEMGVRIG